MDTVIGLFVSPSGTLYAHVQGGRCRPATAWEMRHCVASAPKHPAGFAAAFPTLGAWMTTPEIPFPLLSTGTAN